MDDLLNGPGKRDFFETFIFENFNDFAMNWFLSDYDIDAMRRSIGAHHDHEVAGSATEGTPAGLAGTRSNSKIANVARKVCKDDNQKQKARLARWFKRRSPVAEPVRYGPEMNPLSSETPS
ncbi:MAG: hypothetical protein JO329_11245 [Planctomycetaceae bacterium]|nr:hypothetical protein [Planctomycetaceae bacterium]